MENTKFNPLSLKGSTNLLNPTRIKQNVNLDEIEKSYTDVVPKHLSNNKNTAEEFLKEYEKNLAKISKESGIKFTEQHSTHHDHDHDHQHHHQHQHHQQDIHPKHEYNSDSDSVKSIDNKIENDSDNDKNEVESKDDDLSSLNDSALDDSDSDVEIIKKPLYTKSTGTLPISSNFQSKDKYVNYLTQEQKHTNEINKVIDLFDDHNDEDFSLETERKKDEIVEKLTDIETLKQSLHDDGVKFGKIPELTPESDEHLIDSVYRSLLMRNDNHRFSTLAEQMINACAYGLEGVFNGKKSYFGYSPDLTGLHNTYRLQLRRMKPDTSRCARSVFGGVSISPFARILLELTFSTITHASINAHNYTNRAISNEQAQDDLNNYESSESESGSDDESDAEKNKSVKK
jgi:hypothetical protein